MLCQTEMKFDFYVAVTVQLIFIREKFFSIFMSFELRYNVWC